MKQMMKQILLVGVLGFGLAQARLYGQDAIATNVTQEAAVDIDQDAAQEIFNTINDVNDRQARLEKLYEQRLISVKDKRAHEDLRRNYQHQLSPSQVYKWMASKDRSDAYLATLVAASKNEAWVNVSISRRHAYRLCFLGGLGVIILILLGVFYFTRKTESESTK